MKSRRMRWAGHVANMVGTENSYIILVEISQGTKPLGGLRHPRENNTKRDLK
jgi:hypothetical protein